MIDVVFLLLIFFLVSAKWRPREDFLPLRIAGAVGNMSVTARPAPLIVYIRQLPGGCAISVGQSKAVTVRDGNIQAGLQRFSQELSSVIKRQKRYADDPIEIICDGKLKWQYLAGIYNCIYGSGLTDITFQMTESEIDGEGL